MEDVTKGADSRLPPSGLLPGLLVSSRHLRGVSTGLKSSSTAINRCNFAGPCTGSTARCRVVMRGMAVAAGQKTMSSKALGQSTWAKNSGIGVESTIPHIYRPFFIY